ncbi:hypothetical protein [Mycobacterium intracellulare]|uniref:hypothetical protein n=1 Tax=Mycobacterium intracellulare TaxID=1767 RepID=UPI001E2D4BB2|nr:hypothetical protein [Mycobacterium intracellulare]
MARVERLHIVERHTDAGGHQSALRPSEPPTEFRWSEGFLLQHGEPSASEIGNQDSVLILRIFAGSITGPDKEI